MSELSPDTPLAEIKKHARSEIFLRGKVWFDMGRGNDASIAVIFDPTTGVKEIFHYDRHP